MSILLPRLPATWQRHWASQYFGAPGLIVLAGLFLLIRLTAGPGALIESLKLSAWNFTAEGSGAALAIQLHPLNLTFLILSLLVLLVGALVSRPGAGGGNQGWAFMLGASAYFLFVSANNLTLNYAVLVFDLCLVYYWLTQGHYNLSAARLFLGILTASALTLTSSLPNTTWGAFLLGLALWLRLGLYPFSEAAVAEKQANLKNNSSMLVYWGLSLAVGIYLVAGSMAGSLPEIWRWLTLTTMLLNGLLAWLIEPSQGQRSLLLVRLILVQTLLPLLLAASLSKEVIGAYAVGLILSLAALWVTPSLGRPPFGRELWQWWPYTPALAATFTLVGMPLFLNWPAWIAIFSLENLLLIGGVMVAQTLALSGLARYWLGLLGQNNANLSSVSLTPGQLMASVAGVVAAVPFLIPGLGPLVLAALMHIEWPAANFTPATLATIVVSVIAAAALGYFRKNITDRLKIPVPPLAEFIQLRWLLRWAEKSLSGIGKLILRTNVILEGQHYLGWALFTALVGVIIVILRET
ncbi:MAG: hypothetical protein JW953_20980 [Anaerolineae bacterium]|nr:hypothetical protein [Anaerolineae bacterium]